MLHKLVGIGDAVGREGGHPVVFDQARHELFSRLCVEASQKNLADGRVLSRKPQADARGSRDQLPRDFGVEVNHFAATQRCDVGSFAEGPTQLFEDRTRAAQERVAPGKGSTEFQAARSETVPLTSCTLLDVSVLFESRKKTKDVVFVQA